VAVDIAGVGVAVAWATNVVERRDAGRFRVTDVDLAPVGNGGRVVLVLFVVVCAAATAHFVMSAWRSWTWARTGPQERHEPTPT
jgi:hypothetical protein